MKKCPRCHKEINENDKFCPHCGLQLTRQTANPTNSMMRQFGIWGVVLCLFMLSTLGYTYFANMSASSPIASTYTVLDYQENAQEKLIYTFKNREDFEKQITNASSLLAPVDQYVKSLSEVYGHEFETKTIMADILSNNNYAIKVEAVATLNGDESIHVTRTFSRSKSMDKIKYQIIKNDCTTYEQLRMSDLSDAMIKSTNEDVYNKIMSEFDERENEFNLKKEKLGHYGLGNYEGVSSLVIYKSQDQYKSVFESTTTGDYSLGI